jgi:tetratricopeptide (TPR) repeat protein
MSRRLMCTLAALAAFTGVARAADDAGTTSVFANGAGNRALALGSAYTAVANDAGGWMWNPGGLGIASRGQFQLTQSSPDELDFRESYAGVVVPSWRWGGLAATYRQFGVAGIEGRDDRNLPTGELESQESEMALGYGRMVGDALSLGAVAKIRRQELGGRAANGVGADLGMMLRPAALNTGAPAWMRDLTVGFALANLLPPSMVLDREEVSDPRIARLGFAVRQSLRATGSALIAFDIESVEGRSSRVHAGLEVTPHPVFDLRIGISGSTFTAGSGVQVGPTEFEYAFENQPLSPVHRFGLTFHFGSTIDQARDRYVAEREAEMQARLDETFETRQRERLKALAAEVDAALVAGDPVLAVERATLLRALDPGHPDGVKLEARSLNAMARTQESAGEFAEAAVTYARAKQAAPGDTTASAGLERCRAESNRRAARTADLQAKFESGLNAFTAGRLVEARSSFEMLLAIRPQDEEARAMLTRTETAIARRAETLVGRARRDLAAGSPSEARTALDQARALDPNAPGLAVVEGQLRRVSSTGTTSSSPPPPPTQDPPRELTGAERREVAQLYQRGLTAMQAGNTHIAMRYWELVWEKAPDYQNVRQSLKQEYLARGMEAFAAGNLAEAVKQWENALRMDPRDPRARAYLSRAQEHLARSREIGSR